MNIICRHLQAICCTFCDCVAKSRRWTTPCNPCKNW